MVGFDLSAISIIPNPITPPAQYALVSKTLTNIISISAAPSTNSFAFPTTLKLSSRSIITSQ